MRRFEATTRHAGKHAACTEIVCALASLSAALLLFGCQASAIQERGEGGALVDSGAFTSDDAEPVEECVGLVQCSLDLHAVVQDCDQHVIQTCSADQGCRDGACVSACDSADGVQGSVGCSFWAPTPTGAANIGENAGGSCFAAFVANTWNSPVTLGAEYDGNQLSVVGSAYTAQAEGSSIVYTPLEGDLPPGKVAIVFLSDRGDQGGPSSLYSIRCPSGTHALIAADTSVVSTGRGHAFHLTSSLPVSAYTIWPYGGAKSLQPTATLLLSDASWTGNYLLMDAWEALSYASPPYSPYVQVVANTDDTHISITPVAPIAAGANVEGTYQGVTHSWTLARGEYIQFLQFNELNGSPLQSDKPVAVFGGHQCMDIPTNFVFCDAAQQQLPPISSWGSEYVAAMFRSRYGASPESNPFRILGAVAGTVLTYDPRRPFGAPSEIGSGDVVTFYATDPFVVSSQDRDHAFYLSSHMTGGGSKPGFMGDPDFVNVVPADQYLDHYVFFADYTYAETNVVVVRVKKDDAFAEVTLDCSGPVGNWTPIGDGGRYEFAYVDLGRAFHPVVYDGGTCTNGGHEISSANPFGVTVWGWGDEASYGYPAGAGLRPLNSVIVPIR